jgi:hypothetical protein
MATSLLSGGWPSIYRTIGTLSFFLVDHAVDATVQIEHFVGEHEGIIKRRRDFRLDIDGDGDSEIVVLVDVGSALRRGGNTSRGAFLAVVLDRIDGKLRRIPVDRIEGWSFYGPHRVELVNISGGVRPELKCSWFVGENGIGFYFLTWNGTSYEVIRKQTNDLENEVISTAGFFEYDYQPLQIVDYDGDGISEVVQCFMVHSQTDAALLEFQPPNDAEKLVSRCEVWKWDASTRLMTMVDETAVASVTRYDELQ